MNFMESFKRLEKLCADVMNSAHPVKAYYNEMESLPRGAAIVPGDLSVTVLVVLLIALAIALSLAILRGIL